MVIHTVVEAVLDGAIIALTLEAKDNETIISCRFELSESGGHASLKDCRAFSDDIEKLSEAFTMIVSTLKTKGVEIVVIDSVNASAELRLSLERWIS